MLCCDGFRHVVDPREFYQLLNPQVSVDAATMQQNLVYLTELNKQLAEAKTELEAVQAIIDSAAEIPGLAK